VPVGLFLYESPHSHFLAVSRTCTAPFDRLKIFLITRSPELGGPSPAASAQVTGLKTIMNAVARIYSEGGVLAFWTGNGLSVAKIFPESAIKFFTYESSVSSTYPLLKSMWLTF
jgi:solute carrier family 25 phosphate transporter 23/24/25/41